MAESNPLIHNGIDFNANSKGWKMYDFLVGLWYVEH